MGELWPLHEPSLQQLLNDVVSSSPPLPGLRAGCKLQPPGVCTALGMWVGNGVHTISGTAGRAATVPTVATAHTHVFRNKEQVGTPQQRATRHMRNPVLIVHLDPAPLNFLLHCRTSPQALDPKDLTPRSPPWLTTPARHGSCPPPVITTRSYFQTHPTCVCIVDLGRQPLSPAWVGRAVRCVLSTV